MLTKEQLEKHNASITGSKVGAILGVCPFESKYSLYTKMAGIVPHEVFSSERMEMGSFSEVMFVAINRRKLGRRVGPGPMGGREHPKYDFLWGLVDAFELKSGPRQVLEFKNVDGIFQRKWEDEGIPPHIECQVRFYQMLWDMPGELQVIFGGNHFVQYPIERDAKIERFLLDACLEFWDDLQTGKVPDPDGSDASTEAVKAMFPTSDGIMLPGTQAQKIMLEEYVELSAAEKESKHKKSEISNQMKVIIGEADGLVWEDGSKVTWKKAKDGSKFDEGAFKAKHPELWKEFQKDTTGSRRFLTTIK